MVNKYKDGKEDFFSSKLIQDAVIRNLEVIGERLIEYLKNFEIDTKMSLGVKWQD